MTRRYQLAECPLCEGLGTLYVRNADGRWVPTDGTHKATHETLCPLCHGWDKVALYVPPGWRWGCSNLLTEQEVYDRLSLDPALDLPVVREAVYEDPRRTWDLGVFLLRDYDDEDFEVVT